MYNPSQYDALKHLFYAVELTFSHEARFKVQPSSRRYDWAVTVTRLALECGLPKPTDNELNGLDHQSYQDYQEFYVK